MYFEKSETDKHTGVETLVKTFEIREQDDLYDVRGAFVRFEIRPDTVTLVWERYGDGGTWGPWRRVSYGPRGPFSAVSGGWVLANGSVSDKQRAVVEPYVDGKVGGELTAYAKSLPGLADLIERLEKTLPQ